MLMAAQGMAAAPSLARRDSGVARACGAPACAAPATTTRTTTRRRRPSQPVAAASGPSTPPPAPAAAKEVYDGVYGPWSMEPSDVAEVWGYRACIGAAALCGAAAAAEMLLLPSSSSSPPPIPLDLLLAGGAAGLGGALVLVHVYVAPLKRFVQLLWIAGVGGCALVHANAAAEAAAAAGGGGAAADGAGAAEGLLAAAAAITSSSSSVLAHVASHPLWDGVLVGPLAAAATGLAVKEGFCFRRPEAAALALLLPALCLTHLLSGAWPSAAVVVPLFGAGAALSGLALAVGKLGQDPKGDVGDKSVFEFRKMGEEERERALARLRAADESALRADAAQLEAERRRRRAMVEEDGGGGGRG